MTTSSQEHAENAALVLKYGDANQSIVKGLNKHKIPELTRNVLEKMEFRNDFDYEETAGGKMGRFTYGGFAVFDDTKGQNQLKEYLKANTKFSDARDYLNLTDFITCDLANDTNSSMQVSRHVIGEADKNGVYPFECEIVCNGQIATFLTHMIDGATPTLAFVQGSGSEDTITDSGSGFVTAGFEAGQTLIVEGSTSNDGQYLIKTVAAGTITLTVEGSLTSEAAIEGTTLHGGKL